MSGWTEARTIPADDLHQHVGQNFFSHWFVVDQDRIDAFARVTEDEQFIHVDPAQASLTPFGGTVAHGFFDAVAPVVDGLQRAAQDRGARRWA
jgi:acyl dehydratase